MKRKCKVCGLVHKYAPFIDCFDGDKEEIPDDLQTAYLNRFGE